MRILVINYEYPPIGGGGGIVTRDILEEMVREGHSLTVMTSHYEGLLKKEVVNGVNIIRTPILFRRKIEVATTLSMIFYFPSSVIKSLFNLRNQQFDIINTHFAIPSGPSGYLLSKIFNIPNVLSIHGGDIFDPSKKLSPHKTPLLSKTVSIMLRASDRVVAQSSDTKNNATHYYKVKRSIDIIPLGIKKPVYKKDSRKKFNLDPEDFVFCTIGRLIKRKNIGDILKVLLEIKNDYQFKLIIIGEGPERSRLVKFISFHHLENRVMLVGNVSDETKFQFLDLSDCYLSTASHEGFGLVFLEAMETGNPIICYNRGGQNDFLIDGKTGFIVELDNLKQFKEKITILMEHPDLCSRIGAYNREHVKNYYINQCVKKYLSLFEETVSKYKKYN